VTRSANLRLATVVVAGVFAAGCTGSADEPQAPAERSSDGALGLGGNQPDGAAIPSQTALAKALATVPPTVLYASFTDLDAVKRRLGFAGVDSNSPVAERFAFWEAARADATMLTGTRLYDDASLMSAQYGWTADDVAWEIDFTANETGCTRDMLCDPSNGAVLALRDDVAARTVIQSFAANGFELQPGGQVWSRDEAGQPFDRALYLPELNAVAIGNPIGMVRLSQVAAGAPSLADQIPALASELGSPLSAYLDLTGCVSVGEALGPDATDDEMTGYVEANDPSQLAPASAWAVPLDSGRSATSYLALTADEPMPSAAAERVRRAAILAGWTSIQAGVDFDDVATGVVAVDGSIERVSYEVAAMPMFAAMVLTHDAPWALCATSAPT
jgi:hypothetical protein